MYALRKWRGLVFAGQPVLVCTDHAPLKIFGKDTPMSTRFQRWLDFFGEHDLIFEHHPGKANTAADSLSRTPEEDADIQVNSVMIIEKSEMEEGDGTSESDIESSADSRG